MARLRSTARRYAEAAMTIAERDGTTEAWLAALETAASALSDEEVTRFLANPAVPRSGRRQVAERILGDAVTGSPRNLVLLLVQRNRIELLPAVAREYRRLHHRREGIVEASVTSASPLTEVEADAIGARLAAMTGSRVVLSSTVDATLLGGVTVRLGDRLIDGSVRGRLERLRTKLASGAL